MKKRNVKSDKIQIYGFGKKCLLQMYFNCFMLQFEFTFKYLKQIYQSILLCAPYLLFLIPIWCQHFQQKLTSFLKGCFAYIRVSSIQSFLMEKQNKISESKKYRKVGPYLLSHVIGKGAYSIVYQAKKQGQKKRFAVKQISLLQVSSKQIQRIHLQIKVLTLIKHKNIVALIDFKQTSRNLYLVFEYCRHTDLEAYVDKYSIHKMPEEKVKKIAIQLRSAFQVLRQNKVVHRDLKLANILVTEDFQIKIADFGFAKHLDDNEFFKSYVGTPLTMAPEIMENRNYNQKCDLWSLGIMLYQLLFGKNPFFTKDKMTKAELKNAIKGELKIPDQISLQAKDLLKKLIVRQPAQRISFEDFFKHPWLTGQCSDNNLDEELLEQALRAELKNILLVSNRKREQKEFLQARTEDLLSYQIIENIKNSIEAKIMFWINVGKKIISMQYHNLRLNFLGVAVIMQNLEKYKTCNFILHANENRKIVFGSYNQIRKLQKWEMSEYTKRLPGFMERSEAKMIDYMKSLRETLKFTKSEELDGKINQLFLRELTQQVRNQIQNKASYEQLLVFLKIKPTNQSSFYIRISSNLFNENTIDMLLKKMSVLIENNKMYKKCAGIFKLETLHRDEPEDRIYQNIKSILQ